MVFRFIVFVLPIILFLVSMILLSKWKYLLKFMLVNILLFILYIAIVIYVNTTIVNYDENSFTTILFTILEYIALHSVVVLLFSIYQNFKLKNNEKSIKK